MRPPSLIAKHDTGKGMDVQNPFLPGLVLTVFGKPDFRCLSHWKR